MPFGNLTFGEQIVKLNKYACNFLMFCAVLFHIKEDA
jgi:hypothetical protein